MKLRPMRPISLPSVLLALCAVLAGAAVLAIGAAPSAQPGTPAPFDLDGDGVEDVLVAEPSLGPDPLLPGWVQVESGADGSLLAAFEGETLFDYFGYAAAPAGDVDLDGHSDLIIATPLSWEGLSLGRVAVYSGYDGRVLFTLTGQPGDTFGVRVGTVGDEDGDGVGDLLVAAHFYDQRRNVFEIEYVFSGAHGGLIDFQPDSEGRLIRLAADVDGSATVTPADAVIVTQEVGTDVPVEEPVPTDVNADGVVDADDVAIVVQDQGLGVGALEPEPVLPRLAEWPVTGLEPVPAAGTYMVAHGGSSSGSGTSGGGTSGSGSSGGIVISNGNENGETDCGTSVTLSPKPKWRAFASYPEPMEMVFHASGSPGGGTYSWSVSGATKKEVSEDGRRCTITIRNPGPVKVTVRYTYEGCTARNVARFTAFTADLDVDSDNNNGLGAPDGTVQEDLIEADYLHGKPGKVLFTNNGDADGDGVPDYADGLGYEWGDDATPEPGLVKFIPVRARIGGLPDGTVYRVRFAYDDADPSEITRIDNNTTPPSYTYDTGPGKFRLWTRLGSEERNPADVAEGGDFIVAGVEYDPELLGIDSTGVATFYLEALHPSSSPGYDVLLLDLFILEEGDEPVPTACLSDVVSVTAVELWTHDLRHWGPRMLDDGGGIADTELRRLIPGSTVGGAITDGVSVCLLRLTPWIEDLPDVRVRVVKRGEQFRNRPDILGGITPIQGDWAHLKVPMPEAPLDWGIECEQPFSIGLALYLPPEAYIDRVTNPGAPSGLEPGETTAVEFEVTYNGVVIGRTPFLLRRPPIVLVHGILSSADTWGDGPGEWTEGAAGTRIYRADYGQRSTLGYSENYTVVPGTIHRALEDYRLGRDQDPSDPVNTHEPSRGFRGVRYAATRADVVGHSMGGQLTRFYMSGLDSYPTLTPRGPRSWNWPPMVYFRHPGAPTFNRPFLRDENYGAGDIRRFIPIGSPFNGSPIANTVEPWLRPTDLNVALLLAARDNPFLQLSNELREYLFYANTDVYRAPTCVFDLQEGSVAQRLLEGPPGLYPTGDRAILWHPIVGIATQDIGGAPVQGVLWELLFHFAPGVPSTPGEISPLSPANSDLIVSQWSQRNASNESDFPNAGYGTAFEFHAHVNVPVPGMSGETTSAQIRATVSELLSRPRTFFHKDGLHR